MSYQPYRFSRPTDLTLVARPKLSVAVVIACRDGQEKLDLVLASLRRGWSLIKIALVSGERLQRQMIV